MGAADMVTIGTGRDDPRQWVKVAYTVNDAIQCGQTGSYGKLTTRSELARTLSVHPQTVARAYKELADLGIIYLIPGHGYFSTDQA
jgi:DNA-binding GntR family transcriptional regulator